MQRNPKRLLARAAVVGLAATAAIAGPSSPASAHATVKTDNTVAGTYTVLTFSIGHGCEDEPTNEVAIEIPEPILSVSPTVNAGWEIEKVDTTLDEPVADSHGNEVTERVGQVIYTTDDPLPDGYRDVFELSLRLPEETAGQTLHFPVVQSCPEGEHAWIQIAEDGQDPDELDEPAPFIEVTAPGQAAQEAEPAADDDGETAADDAADESSGGTLTYVALALGALGVLLGGFGLLRGRRNP
ncbi:YcnI family copper-binding membrane protein [Glycomyces xiaoerkulensis]|uniref:YcnI family copper-binding membrane protein n=1 Tax=Glycomyces xiaoerkulensis TaxID=2038139 RepID=UPI000C26A8D1|nr:YcnI family protein [Glycomyces xiaoerkulensis]